MIEFRDVHASYDGSAPILKGVSFTLSLIHISEPTRH